MVLLDIKYDDNDNISLMHGVSSRDRWEHVNKQKSVGRDLDMTHSSFLAMLLLFNLTE